MFRHRVRQALSRYSGRKREAILVIVIFVMTAVFGTFALVQYFGGPSPQGRPQALVQGLGSFQSYSQMKDYIATNAKSAQQYSRAVGGGVLLGMPFDAVNGVMASESTAGPALAPASTVSTATPAFTGTNNQVKGVDEPDIVKTDGVNLFVATGRSVSIINAQSSKTATLSTLSYPNSNVLGIEISQNRLFVVSQRSSNSAYVDLLLYDTSNPSRPDLIQNSSIQGNYVSARLTGNYVYAVIQQPSYTFGSNGEASGVMPTATVNGTSSVLPPSSVYYASAGTQIGFYTMIVSLSMQSGEASTTSVLTGPSSTIYVSQSNIYVVYSNYESYYADNIPGDVFSGGVVSPATIQQQGGQNSTIFRIAYSDGSVSVKAAGTVPGTVLNQFSLDEYNGYFRVATSRVPAIGGEYTRSDDVYVLNSNMSQVSALQNIAPGENIYAVSFDGDMGYVVTFQQVDPLFVISFKDVSHPTIVSALKVSGYSDYLYPLPNGYLIGVGKDAVPSSTGNFSYYLGLKLSLFHVLSNGTSSQVAKFLIGDRGTDSLALTNHLAFTFDPTRNVMVIPVKLAIVSGSQSTESERSPPPFGDYVWQGVYVLSVSSSGFTLLGRVSQYQNGTASFAESPNYNLQIERSAIIGNALYTVSQNEVMVSDLSTFSTLASLALSQ